MCFSQVADGNQIICYCSSTQMYVQSTGLPSWVTAGRNTYLITQTLADSSKYSGDDMLLKEFSCVINSGLHHLPTLNQALLSIRLELCLP